MWLRHDITLLGLRLPPNPFQAISCWHILVCTGTRLWAYSTWAAHIPPPSLSLQDPSLLSRAHGRSEPRDQCGTLGKCCQAPGALLPAHHLALILRGRREEPCSVLLADVNDLEREDIVGCGLLSCSHHSEGTLPEVTSLSTQEMGLSTPVTGLLLLSGFFFSHPLSPPTWSHSLSLDRREGIVEERGGG